MTQQLPRQLYTAEQSQQLDRVAIEQFGIPGITLMKRAGRAAFQCLKQHWLLSGKANAMNAITVLCGGGNNGGDGYIVAGLAAEQHIETSLFYLSDPQKLAGDAALARDFAQQAGVQFQAFNPEIKLQGVVVDAMLGTGSQGAPRGDYAVAIELINRASLPVLAIDCPSGLSANTGATAGAAVKADRTITFICIKQGLLTARGPALCGDIAFDNLDVPVDAYQHVSSSTYCLDYQPLPPRVADAHKGASGHVLVIGGDNGMGGAVAMAAEAAARCGAGLVSVATRAEQIAPILARRPEIMVKAVEADNDLKPLLERATVLIVGPGLGQSEWSKRLLAQALTTSLPTVIDADALTLLSKNSKLINSNSSSWVLTPHPGEAARLLGQETNAIQADRFKAVASIQQQFGGVAVLKGAGSLVASVSGIGLCHAGNPGMASGGMGDVLSGVIGGLLAQGLDLKTAAEKGVQIHGMAGDRAARRGQRGLLATDLMPHLRSLVNGKD